MVDVPQLEGDGSFEMFSSVEIKPIGLGNTFAKGQSRLLQSVGSDGEGSVKISPDSKLKLAESYLKLTQSIRMELVPGSDLYLDKKGFSWELTGQNEYGFSFSVRFENPKYISVGSFDSIKIQFFNTEEYLQPQSGDLLPLPSGYTIVAKIPPQSEG